MAMFYFSSPWLTWTIVLLGLCFPTAMLAHDETEGSATQPMGEVVLGRRDLSEGRELVCVRGPDLGAGLMTDLYGPPRTAGYSAVHELRLEVRGPDGEAATLAAATIGVPGENAAHPKGFPPLPPGMDVLDIGCIPACEGGPAGATTGEVVVAIRMGGGLVFWKVNPLDNSSVWTSATGWNAFDTPVAGDPQKVTLRHVDRKWKADVVSGTPTYRLITTLGQDASRPWAMTVESRREERRE